MKRERLYPEGHLDSDTRVIVKSKEPAETDYDFADMVLQNMKKLVEYEYFFNKDPESLKTIARVIQSLAVAGIYKMKNKEPVHRKNSMGNPDIIQQVKDNLKIMRDRLSVYFLPDFSPPEFFVYTKAKSIQKGRSGSMKSGPELYLRYYLDSNLYGAIEWRHEELFKELTKQLNFLRVPDPDPSFIFRFPRTFRRNDVKDFKVKLLKPLREFFPENLLQDVQGVCFGHQPHKMA
jgi:hypothetical protein